MSDGTQGGNNTAGTQTKGNGTDGAQMPEASTFYILDFLNDYKWIIIGILVASFLIASIVYLYRNSSRDGKKGPFTEWFTNFINIVFGIHPELEKVLRKGDVFFLNRKLAEEMEKKKDEEERKKMEANRSEASKKLK